MLNRYDSQDRVTAQTDAAGGSYRMEYADGHTVTTDAEGNTVTYYYDERKRTTRIVDALGGETAFTTCILYRFVTYMPITDTSISASTNSRNGRIYFFIACPFSEPRVR